MPPADRNEVCGKLFERYVYAGALTRDADAVAALFTPDGVLEAPLVPADSEFPRRLEGRDAIREGLAAWYATTDTAAGEIDTARSRVVVHETSDPDVFIAEIDAALKDADVMSLVQIFRVRDGLIAHLRDYFALPR